MNKLTNNKDLGLLLIRVAIGICMFAFHGLPKLSGGVNTWTKIGQTMQTIGINFLPTFWGFSAALVESIGALLFIIGLQTRISSVFLAFTMLMACVMHFSKGDSWSSTSHAIELMTIFIAFAFMGPGRYSVDKK